MFAEINCEKSLKKYYFFQGFYESLPKFSNFTLQPADDLLFQPGNIGL